MRYLFGPVRADFARDKLGRLRASGTCLAFGPDGPVDLVVGPCDTWTDVAARFPAGWQPDFIALWLAYTSVPGCLWQAPVPLLGLAGDWNLLWHGYRELLPLCAALLTDTPGVAALHGVGLRQARPANLYGSGAAFLEPFREEGPRDIDVLFVGNLNPAVQRQRMPWLGRLARLADRYQVVIRTGVFGAEYRRLLGRARIVFNRSARGECNQRVFEAAAADTLLFQEAENQEVSACFRDREECVYYTADDLEGLLEHYLTHEDERREIANAARRQVGSFQFPNLWEASVTALAAAGVFTSFATNQGNRSSRRPTLQARVWQQLSRAADARADPLLVLDLRGPPPTRSKPGLPGMPSRCWRRSPRRWPCAAGPWSKRQATCWRG
jgi:hypothetical protein